MSHYVGVLWLLIILQTQKSDCLDCYGCNNLQSVTKCHNVVICQADYVCSIVANATGDNILFNLGCRHKDQCPNLSQSTTVSPGPSIIGRDLTSDTCDTCCIDDGCNKRMCPNFLDGIWSNWTPWTSCDITCGNGTISRVRMCDNPTPANGGLPCAGAKKEQRQCKMSPCPVQHVAFSVYNPSSTLNGSIPVSWHTNTNIGGGFNATAGKFTCPIKGLYTFSVTVSVASNSFNFAVQCYVYYDNAQGQSISTNHYAVAFASPGTHTEGSVTTQLELSLGDTVYLTCDGWFYVNSSYTHFSGSLISL